MDELELILREKERELLEGSGLVEDEYLERVVELEKELRAAERERDEYGGE